MPETVMSPPPSSDSRTFPPPEKFSFQPKDWLTWKKRWEQYHLLTSLSDRKDAYQVAALLYSMGDKSEEILASLRLSDSDKVVYKKVFDAFDSHFVGLRNVVYERAMFGSRCQRDGESIEDFVTSLHTLSETCEYGSLREDLVRDRIVLGVSDKRLSEKLMLTGKLTLTKALEMAQHWEKVKFQQQSLNSDGNKIYLEAVSKKGRIGKSRSGQQGLSTSQPQRKGQSSRMQTILERECKFCGRKHKMIKSECPAVNANCRSCRKKGHFEVKCPNKTSVPVSSSSSKINAFEIDTICSMESSQTSALKRSASWEASVRVNGIWILFKLDSGAEVSAIPQSLFEKVFSKKHQLKRTGIKLTGPVGHELKVVGYFSAKLKYKDVEALENIYVIRQLGQPLLSLSACQDLKLILRINRLEKGTSSINAYSEFPEVFSGLGKLDTPYTIKVKPKSNPFAIYAPRRVPIPLMGKVKQKLEEMETHEVIVKVDEPSDWCAPLVVVPKPNEDIRLCVDLSVLNQSVKREYHPMPVVEHTLAQLGSAKFFSKLDANSGFFQILLSEECQKLTTFITPFGRYCFKRLPFGISSAPEVFQKRMEQILRDLPGVVVQIDDVLVYGSDAAEHDHRLRAVLERIRTSGLTLNKEKCQIGVTSIKFLGHIIDKDGVRPDPDKISAIVEMPPPSSITDVRRFLGLVNYLGRFVPHLSSTVKPILDLTRKDYEFVWGPAQEAAFTSIKLILTKDPVLCLYDPNRDTVVSSDSSSFGLGAVLLQKQDNGKFGPVAFASRTLSPTEQRYAQIEKEALGITWACERFRDYITGKEILIETDHKPLLQVLQTKGLNDLTPRLQRLRIRLMRYKYIVTYVPGKLLITADALSRQPLSSTEDVDLSNDLKSYACCTISSTQIKDKKLQVILREQLINPVLKQVIEYSTSSWPKKIDDPLLKPYWNVRDSLSVCNNLLLKDSRIVIPPSLRQDILGQIHEGHLGVVKCRARARVSCWYPGMSADIGEMVRRCPICVKERVEHKEPLLPSEFPTRPWQILGMDLFKYEGKWFLLTVDYYSRYPEIAVLPNMSTLAVIDFLKKIFSRHGVPEEIRSDNGTQFHPLLTSPFQKFAEEYGFIHTTSSPRYPQSNGFVENFVKISIGTKRY